jgi:pimeloyl-ACP methyl ester carboxylesterase
MLGFTAMMYAMVKKVVIPPSTSRPGVEPASQMRNQRSRQSFARALPSLRPSGSLSRTPGPVSGLRLRSGHGTRCAAQIAWPGVLRSAGLRARLAGVGLRRPQEGKEWTLEEPRSFFVAVQGTRLRLLEWGEPGRPPVLMVHGMRAHAHWFAPVAPALRGRFRVLSLDLRGHGESAQTPPYGPLVYAEDLQALVEALDLRELVLLGHSMGGGVALRAAPQIAERLRALVLVDSNIGGPTPPWYGEGPGGSGGADLEERWAARQRQRAGQSPRVYPTAEEALSRFRLLPGDTVVAPELLRYLAEHAIRELPDGGFTWRFAPDLQGGMPRTLPASELAAIRCPVLLIYGERSPIASRVSVERVLALFHGASTRAIERIPGAHHHVFLDQPEAFNRALLQHLNSEAFQP